MNVPALSPPPKESVLGVGVSVVEYAGAVDFVMHRARRNEPTTVSALAVHGVMTGVLDEAHRGRLNGLDLVTPDGQPVRWAVNLLGKHDLQERVYGPELMLRLCSAAQEAEVSVYLYGSTGQVVESLSRALRERFPRLTIAGAQPHRFRDPTPAEDAEDVDRINGSGAGIVFVGTGCPRQEVWAFEHRDRINAVLVCVGAAFDFHAGLKGQAPAWMQARGLEWLYRLVSEPRRLWRRYVLLNPAYLLLLLGQWSGLWHPTHGLNRGGTPPHVGGRPV